MLVKGVLALLLGVESCNAKYHNHWALRSNFNDRWNLIKKITYIFFFQKTWVHHSVFRKSLYNNNNNNDDDDDDVDNDDDNNNCSK